MAQIGKALWSIFIQIAMLMLPYFFNLLQRLAGIVLPELINAALSGGVDAKAKAKKKIVDEWESYLDQCQADAGKTLSPIDDWLFKALKAAGKIEESYIGGLVDFAFMKSDEFFRRTPGSNPGASPAK